jgi:hypothetical protein
MRVALQIALLLLTTAADLLYGQGTFMFDQQSSTDESLLPGSGGSMTLNPPAQSFTPALTSVGFIRLKFDDGSPFDSLGASIYVNLRANSVNGTILGSTALVTMRSGFAGVTNLFFADPVAVTPGATYFFEPVQSAGGPWNIEVGPYVYPGGIFYAGGNPAPGADLWFREGIIVPEPSSALLALLGAISLTGVS